DGGLIRQVLQLLSAPPAPAPAPAPAPFAAPVPVMGHAARKKSLYYLSILSIIFLSLNEMYFEKD
ncbi:hypothetical protein CDAR_277971, partial [Caerostris darwini]